MQLVPNITTLRAMANAGLIRLHADTGAKVRHWTGCMVTALYVDDVCEGVKQPFEFKGRRYELKYFDGCFCPFVIDVDYAEQLDVRTEKIMA